MTESFTSIAKVFPALEGFILDETVEDIHINPNGTAFIKRRGAQYGELIGENLFSQGHLLDILRTLSRYFGKDEINANNPFLWIDFEDGTNFTATIPPVTQAVAITMSRIPPPKTASAKALELDHLRRKNRAMARQNQSRRASIHSSRLTP
jgi:type IV secretory pathway ATPase VirB11/archaellum biosynthesis ATPase